MVFPSNLHLHFDAVVILAQFECGPLPPLLNGQILIENGKAIYICDPGFFLIGKEFRICDLSNNWSDRQPVCEGMAHDYCMIVICGLVLSNSPRTATVVEVDYYWNLTTKLQQVHVFNYNHSYSAVLS